MSEPTTNPTALEELQSIFDQGTDDGPYGVTFTATSVQLVDVHTKQIIREVQWPGAWEFARNVLSNSLGQQ